MLGLGNDDWIFTFLLKTTKQKDLEVNFSYGMLIILFEVHSCVQGILTTVHVLTQRILNKVYLRVLSPPRLQYIHASVVGHPCGGK